MMKFFIGALAVSMFLVGCGSGDVVEPSAEHTEGGNVVDDPALRDQLTGAAGAGGAAASTEISGN